MVTVGNDADLQVALTTLADPSYDLHVMTEMEQISERSRICKTTLKRSELLIHTGCDSTSTPFMKGTAKAVAAHNKLTAKEMLGN